MRKRLSVALGGALALWMASAAAYSDAQFISSLTWSRDDPHFGGFSGLEVFEDGTRFIALSDRGRIVEGNLVREDGRIVSIEAGELIRLKNHEGTPLKGKFQDSEGLARSEDGTLFISFEANHRVWRYPGSTAIAERFRRHQDFRRLQNNSSLEAVAIAANGDVFTLPERSGELDRPFPVYRLRGKTWERPFTLSRSGPFLPVGADFGPDGKLYLLERRLAGFLGFQTRVRRFEIGETGVQSEETILQTRIAEHDNLEGISVWRDEGGRIRLTMISDDNQRFFQRTEIVEYIVTD